MPSPFRAAAAAVVAAVLLAGCQSTGGSGGGSAARAPDTQTAAVSQDKAEFNLAAFLNSDQVTIERNVTRNGDGTTFITETYFNDGQRIARTERAVDTWYSEATEAAIADPESVKKAAVNALSITSDYDHRPAPTNPMGATTGYLVEKGDCLVYLVGIREKPRTTYANDQMRPDTIVSYRACGLHNTSPEAFILGLRRNAAVAAG